MKQICILTSTRAEYGLLKNIIVKLEKVPEFETKVVVTGMHLSPEFGLTYREIENDEIKIDKKIEILLSADSQSAVSKSMGLALIQFANYFEESTPDLLLVLGDRYETLAVCIAAMNQRIPIAHLHGGETTEGAIDEAVRHAITKMSYLHFTSTEEYRKRVIQLGESPDRVFCVGATGVENAKTQVLMSREDLGRNLAFDLREKYAVVTFHPVTLEKRNEIEQIEELLIALEHVIKAETFICKKIIITKANADAGGRKINQLIDEFASKHSENILAVESLGMRRYLSALKYCAMVIGNSSSGLLEAPSFQIPTINIGDRQKGRIKASSVIDCEATHDEIIKAIKYACTDEFRKVAKETVNPYGAGDTSDKISEILREHLFQNKINLMKKFYDITFEV